MLLQWWKFADQHNSKLKPTLEIASGLGPLFCLLNEVFLNIYMGPLLLTKSDMNAQ